MLLEAKVVVSQVVIFMFLELVVYVVSSLLLFLSWAYMWGGVLSSVVLHQLSLGYIQVGFSIYCQLVYIEYLRMLSVHLTRVIVIIY